MTWSLHNLWSFRHSHGPRLLCLRRTSPRITCRLYSLEFQPFGSSIVSCFLGNHSRHLFGGNRQLLLGGSVGVSVGVTLVLGLLSGYFTLPYLVFTNLYGTIAAVTLQYLYKNV
ncbi:unnamed protein product, partial [Mesorhabditis belari]|uniref:Uncharacterized protein n=1 Tax=Mesorhabditis belari TaxID=2138241 RepID=A0AAF3F075_9BILA